MTLIEFLFPKLRTPKTLLYKRLKSPVSEDCGNLLRPSTVEIFIKAPLSYLLITVKAIELEKVCLIDTPNLGTAF